MKKVLVGGLALLLTIGCGTEPEETGSNADPNTQPSCGSGKCDANTGLIDALDGREDPIAQWIRQQPEAAADGVVDADYEEILLGINALLGCPDSDVKTFIVSDALLTGDQALPRTVSVACASNTSHRFKLFMSSPEATEEGDVDASVIEMFAWDDDEDVFRFYKVEPGEDGRFEVDVEPSECAGCHLAPESLMRVDGTGVPMMPIMNELTEPWSHWNAEPAFRSQDFALPEGIEGFDNYATLTGNGRLGAANQLEQIIRDAQKRVVSKRYKSRKDEASVAAAMGLLRPLFCEEQVNYVSERGDSGLLSMGFVVDDNIRELYRKINATDWNYPWWYNQTKAVRFTTTAATVEDQMRMIPVRGEIDRALELKLVRALSAEKLLQIRALDWQTPVFSDFRCGLWVSARERLRQDPPVLEGETNEDVLEQLYAEIMQVDGVSLVAPEGAELIVLDSANDEAVEALKMMAAAGDFPAAGCEVSDPSAPCACGELGVCAAGLQDFAQVIQTRVNELESQGRDTLRVQGQGYICSALEQFSATPFIETAGECE